MNNTKLTNNPEILKKWIGKTTKKTDFLDARQARLLQATLNQKPNLKNGDEMPPLRHWCYFNDETITNQLGQDGHPKRGNFMPPVKLKNRMWAESKVSFHKPIILGQEITRTSTISDIKPKIGKNGKLCFVTVTHKYKNKSTLCVTDEHTIVYKNKSNKTNEPNESGQSNKKSAIKIPKNPTKIITIKPDTITMFRYSALTFNNHRIHYDLKYCQEVEGYPGLVVHGPLIATLLIDLAKKLNKKRTIRTFGFKAVAPIFDTIPFKTKYKKISEEEVAVWAETKNNLAMFANVTLY